MSERAFHDFYAPIDGVATKFSVRCDGGAPKWLGAMEPLHVKFGDRGRALYQNLDLINHLLRDIPWAALCLHRHGNLGAILEAAEARRGEIYGPMTEAA